MSQADAEQRHMRPKDADDFIRQSRFTRRTRPRRDQDALRLQRFNLLDGEFVVAANQHIRPKLAQVLNKVIGEGIVVIEDKNHR